MQRFFQLSEDEQCFLNDFNNEKFIPAIIIRSDKKAKDFLPLLRTILRAGKKDDKVSVDYKCAYYETIKRVAGYHNRMKTVTQHKTFIYLTPEARDVFLQYKHRLIKYQKYSNLRGDFEILYFNKEWKLADAMSLPVCVCNPYLAKKVAQKMVEKFPYIKPVVLESQESKDTLVSYTVDYFMPMGKQFVQASHYKDVCKFVEKSFDVDMVDAQGVKIEKELEMEC